MQAWPPAGPREGAASGAAPPVTCPAADPKATPHPLLPPARAAARGTKAALRPAGMVLLCRRGGVSLRPADANAEKDVAVPPVVLPDFLRRSGRGAAA